MKVWLNGKRKFGTPPGPVEMLAPTEQLDGTAMQVGAVGLVTESRLDKATALAPGKRSAARSAA